jgi:hypothetical protein
MSKAVEWTGTTAEICQRFEPGDAARQLLRPGLSPKDFVKLLDAHQLFVDGIRFVAYALPSREAIWWGCLCAWSVHRPKPAEKIATAFSAVVAWIQEPNEENRRAAEAASEVAGADTPAGGLASAIFLSGANIAPPKQPEVKPKPFLWSKALAGAVGLATNLVPPDKKKPCERQFLTLATDVADGRIHWEPRAAMGEVLLPRHHRTP